MPLTLTLAPDALSLEVQLPSGTSITIPPNEPGARFLQSLLQAQQRGGSSKVGSDQSPLQSAVKEWLTKNKPKKFQENGRPLVSPEELLLELGL